MALPDDLLQEARDWVAKGKTKPRQASLRRAVSSAYYALFHLLAQDASHMVTKGKRLRPVVRRALQHSTMLEASNSFRRGLLPPHLKIVLSSPISQPLKTIAEAFVDLQQARHEADYDVNKRFAKKEVDTLITRVRDSFDLWRSQVAGAEKELYLASLLLWRQWRR